MRPITNDRAARTVASNDGLDMAMIFGFLQESFERFCYGR